MPSPLAVFIIYFPKSSLPSLLIQPDFNPNLAHPIATFNSAPPTFLLKLSQNIMFILFSVLYLI